MEALKQQLRRGAMTGALTAAHIRTLLDLAPVAYADGNQGQVPSGGPITQLEVNIATLTLMTGPKATPPRWRAIRKAVSRLRKGLPLEGAWRSWPAIKKEVEYDL